MTAKVLKIVCLGILVLLLGVPSLAQNTKGDRPAPTDRETRFKTPKKSPKQRTGRRVRRGDDKPDQRNTIPPRKARAVERAGRPVTPMMSRSRPRNTQRAWKGNITGRRIQPRASSGRAKNVYPQPAGTNYSSQSLRRTLRQNDNPNVKRVQRMQRDRSSRPKVGKPIRPVFHKSRPQKSERAWRGDITGRKIRAGRTTPRSPAADRSFFRASQPVPGMRRSRSIPSRVSGRALFQSRAGKPIRPVFHKSRPQKSERAWRGDITGRKIRAGRITPRPPAADRNFFRASQRIPGGIRRSRTIPPRISGRARNVYSNKSFYVNNRSRRQTTGTTLSILRQQTGQPSVRRHRKVTPRSASAAFLSRRSINKWAHFKRSKHKQEQAITTDLAGRRIRGRNYETERPILTNPTLNYKRRIATGERPYRGPAAGGHVSRTKQGRAWKGDITHRAIRGGFRSKKGEPQPGAPLLGRGPGRQALRTGKYQGNIRTGSRGFGDQGENYTGNIRQRKRLEGGGSITRGWNNKGLPIEGRAPGKGSSGVGYSGNIRAGKRIFNDQGEESSGNIRTNRRRGFSDQGEEYTGHIRSNGRRGLSNQGEQYRGNIRRDRRAFKSQGEEYAGNIRRRSRAFSDQGEEYTGNIRFQRPLKGGGSRSGKHWNNNNTPIVVRTPAGKAAEIAGYQGDIRARRAFNDQGEEYTGNIKTRRPAKGGGSVSGKLWNNNERPIEGRGYADQRYVSRYSGNIKAQRPQKGGGSVSGKLWNNDENPIAVRAPKIAAERNYSGNIKLARSDYKRNPKSAMGALQAKRSSASAIKADQYDRGVRRDWNYIRNPSSADDALVKREPGRAFGRSADYQGNIRIKKFDLFGKSDLHPDARFVRLNKNNVDEEKDMFTNLKLWWARLFRRSETQPDHLKDDDKDHKPRYDKGEAGLWYD